MWVKNRERGDAAKDAYVDPKIRAKVRFLIQLTKKIAKMHVFS